MLEKITGLPPGIVGVKAVGKVAKEDYEAILEPIFDGARQQGHKLRLLYEFAPDFEGFSPAAAWEDLRFGRHALRLLEGCAVVSDTPWIRESAKFVAFWLPCPLHVFASEDRAQALEFLGSLPEKARVSHRLLPEAGVIVVDVKEALRAQDFDALTATADTFIHAQGRLNGLVLHAEHFPGWENLASLLKHVRFVRDHHAKIERIALVTDAKAATFMPRIAEHFVKAELKHFPYASLEDAIAWAHRGSR
jgi:hypothetical protein